MLKIIALAVVAFASTNIDDIFVLIGFFSNRALSRIAVIAGQYIGITALTGGSIACALLTFAIPDQYIRYLGVLPVVIGLWHLIKRFRSEGEKGAPAVRAGAGTAFSVAAVTMANGADNIAAYVPLFGHQSAVSSAITCTIFALMTGAWCAAAVGLMAHPKVGAIIRRCGDWIMPVILIVLGLSILSSR